MPAVLLDDLDVDVVVDVDPVIDASDHGPVAMRHAGCVPSARCAPRSTRRVPTPKAPFLAA